MITLTISGDTDRNGGSLCRRFTGGSARCAASAVHPHALEKLHGNITRTNHSNSED